MSKKLYVVAGDCGVYVGMMDKDSLGADGRVELTGARHLRRYYVAGRKGDGSAGDLAVKGLDPDSPSIGAIVPGVSVLLGVRRAFEVCGEVAASFE